MRTIQEIKENVHRKGWTIKQQSIDGLFIVDYKKRRTIIASWGGGWDHVSINDERFTPTWEEMCELKDIFFKEEETCVEYHPAKSEYVNNLKHCLHIWRPIKETLPTPDSILVGIKGLELE